MQERILNSEFPTSISRFSPIFLNSEITCTLLQLLEYNNDSNRFIYLLLAGPCYFEENYEQTY